MMRSIIALLLISLSTTAQDSILHDPADLRADLNYFRIVLQKAHPSLYRYVAKSSLDSLFEQTNKDINAPMHDFMFLQKIQSVNARIGCGHTNILASLATLKRRDDTVHYLLPFYVAIIDNKLFIQRYIQAPGRAMYRINDQILFINGEAANDILRKMRNMIAGDGYSNAYKDYKLSIGDFNWIYAIIGKKSSEFELVLQRGKSSWTTIINSRVTAKNYRPVQYPDLINGPLLSYYPNLPSTAVLRIKDFTYKHFTGNHNTVFEEIAERKIENLVIDIRNNPGGRSDAVIDLMKYLIPKKFYFSRTTEGVVDFDKFIALFKDKCIPDISMLSEFPHKRFTREYTGNLRQNPHPKTFDGKVFILTNGGTFSSSVLFASALKSQMNCIVIGEETGGGSAGCNGGAIVEITLPHTGFRVKLPLMWTNAVGVSQNKGQGLMPDFYVKSEPMKTDGLNYRENDPLLSRVGQLINQ